MERYKIKDLPAGAKGPCYSQSFFFLLQLEYLLALDKISVHLAFISVLYLYPVMGRHYSSKRRKANRNVLLDVPL